LVYCTNCGEKIADEANFCPRCGTKTLKGRAANVAYPSDELREAFYRVGTELDRAFKLAAHETQAAIQRATGGAQQKANQQGPVACPKCGVKNAYGSVFCCNCGSRMALTEESNGQ